MSPCEYSLASAGKGGEVYASQTRFSHFIPMCYLWWIHKETSDSRNVLQTLDIEVFYMLFSLR